MGIYELVFIYFLFCAFGYFILFLLCRSEGLQAHLASMPFFFLGIYGINSFLYDLSVFIL